MATQKHQFVFNSRHDNLKILWEPSEVIRTVNGVKKFVSEDRQPTNFVNGQFVTTDKLLAKKLLNHRHYGVLFELTPVKVVQDAVQQAEAAQAGEQPKVLIPEDVKALLDDVEEDPVEDLSEEDMEPSDAELAELVADKTDTQVQVAAQDAAVPDESAAAPAQVKVIQEVDSFNEAQSYLKREYNLEHGEVNSKDKIAAAMVKYGIEFPNYDPQ